MQKQSVSIKMIGSIVGLIVIVSGAIASAWVTSDKVAVLEPEVKKNSTFRLETAKDIEYMQKGIERIEKHLGTSP